MYSGGLPSNRGHANGDGYPGIGDAVTAASTEVDCSKIAEPAKLSEGPSHAQVLGCAWLEKSPFHAYFS
jgi:hypothetical protein